MTVTWVPATGFLVSMPVIFEDFVTVAIAEALTKRLRGRTLAQDASGYLDSENEVHLRPDLVWYGLGADRKFRTSQVSNFPSA